jgi:hypothetical protein
VHLIHRNDDLTRIYNDFKDSGYDPKITFLPARSPIFTAASHANIEKRNTILSINIRRQEMIKSSIYGEIQISTEEVYNNMHRAMTNFNNKLFKNEYKSYYSKLDIDIMDEYRSFANGGYTRNQSK